MLRVAALTAGRDVPSTRFRVRQFIEPLLELGVAVREYRPFVEKYATAPRKALGPLWAAAKAVSRLPGVAGSRLADVTWLERDLVAGRRTLEGLLPRRTVLDIDDAIWLAGEPGFSERIAAGACGVIAGNAFLADHYRSHARRVWTVPTCVDTERWSPRARPEGGPWTVGWIGTAGNLPYLRGIEAALERFLLSRSNVQLVVVADREPGFSRLPAARVRFVPWSAAGEAEAVASFDAGLMPLPESDWARGKCGAKMISYMASGVPALVTPVGVNADILALGEVGLGARTETDWVGGLERFYEDRAFATACAATGRKLAVEAFSVRSQAPRLAQIFREAAGA